MATLSSFDIRLKRTGSTGDAPVFLWAVAECDPETNLVSSILASGSKAWADIATSYTTYNFAFTAIEITTEGHYVILLGGNARGAGNKFIYATGADTSSHSYPEILGSFERETGYDDEFNSEPGVANRALIGNTDVVDWSAETTFGYLCGSVLTGVERYDGNVFCLQTAPSKPINPTPAHEAAGVVLRTALLTWESGS